MASALSAGISENPFYTATIADDTTLYSTFETTNPSLPFASMIRRLVLFDKKMAIAPKNANDMNTQEVVDELETYLSDKSGFASSSFLISFASEDALENYISKKNYDNSNYGDGKIAYAIVINSVDIAAARWDYAIRLNYTAPYNEDESTQGSFIISDLL